MEKKLLTNEELESKNRDGLKAYGIEIREFIPYSQLFEAGVELSERTTVITENGFTYRSPLYPVILTYILFKYFTNVDVSGHSDMAGMESLYDFARKNCSCEDTYNFKRADSQLVEDIADVIFGITKERYSLDRKASEVIDFIMEGKASAEDLAKNREVNEKMIDAIAMITSNEKKEEQSKVLTMFAKK